MAAGEYISVSSQRDAEEADLRIEAEALAENRRAELHELAKIYEDRGVEPGLARLVAEQLMAHDALGAHARDELGITEIATARPFQAARTSAAAFTVGARSLPCSRSRSRAKGVRIAVTAVAHARRARRSRRARRATRRRAAASGRAPRRHAVGPRR